MLRREFLAASAAASAQAPKRPNILFVMVDEMRWDAMGCAGHPDVKTPTLDALSRESVFFSNAYTVSPVCCPARASVFTSRYPHVHGVTRNGLPYNDGEIFLPSILRHHGYHTAIAGKLHYNPHRFDFGFDDFWTFTNEGPTPERGHIAHLRKKYGGDGGKWARKDGTCPWPDDPLGRDVGLFKYDKADFETEWITDRSIEYLRARAGDRKPFFLFASYLKPHSPSVEPEPFFSRYDPNAIRVPKLPADAKAIRAKAQGRLKRKHVDDERMMRVMSALYYGAITHIDEELARLFGELKRLGLDDNTIVLFTADHGNMLGDRALWFKDFMYEGSAHVPLMMRAPGVKPKQVKQVIENIDLMPTLLDLAGVPAPEGMQGRSFRKLMTAGDSAWKDRCISDLTSTMHLEGGFKFIDNNNGTVEAYDLAKDPREAIDVAAAPKYRERVEHARASLKKWRAARVAPVKVRGMSMPAYSHIDPEERKKIVANSPAILNRVIE